MSRTQLPYLLTAAVELISRIELEFHTYQVHVIAIIRYQLLYPLRDSNSHTFRRRLLRPTCLPFQQKGILFVTQVGFEPTTYPYAWGCSVQLSYRVFLLPYRFTSFFIHHNYNIIGFKTE